MNETWIRQALARYEAPLVRYAFRITRDLEEAREIVQEVFLRLWQEEETELEPRLAEWLFTVCRNRAIDRRRKDKHMVPLSDDQAEKAASEEAPPGAELESRQDLSEAMRSLSKLPERQQEVIRLKFQNGMTYEQIARVTGLSASNVGYLIHTGLKALRAALAAAPVAAKGVVHE